jgi:N-acetylneuraminic acid mutarotase
VRQADLPFLNGTVGALIGAQGFAINGKGYLCGDFSLNNLWEYDTATKAWTQKANFPGTTYMATNFVIGSAAYILFGNTNWQYDQSTNIWTRKADMPGDSRYEASAFAIGSNGYAGFGFDWLAGGDLNDFYRYEPAVNRWLEMPPFPGSGRGGAMTFTVDSYGYICSGLHSVLDGSPFVYLTDLWQFDPGTGTWVSKQAFPGNGRARGVGLSGPGHGFVGTGNDGAYNYGYYKDFYEYTPSNDSWIRLPDMGNARNQDASFFIGNSLYVAGGHSDPNAFKDFWTLHL